MHDRKRSSTVKAGWSTGNKGCSFGCAEGYYTTGIGAITDIPLILGVDINEKALEQARKASELNGISGKRRFSSDLLDAARLVTGKTLVMIDVEGSEVDVIDQFFLG